jgi:hypothetical protein
MNIKRPILELEKEIKTARDRGLIANVTHNVYLTESYMYISFKEQTPNETKEKLIYYIKSTYEVNAATLLEHDRVLYITFNFWNRFFDQPGG